MSASLNDCAILEDQDLVGVGDGGKTMPVKTSQMDCQFGREIWLAGTRVVALTR